MKNANEIKAMIEKNSISEETLLKEAEEIATKLLDEYSQAIENRLVNSHDHKCRFFLDGDVYQREEDAFLMSLFEAGIKNMHLKANDDKVRIAIKAELEKYGFKVTLACAASTFFIVSVN